MKKFVVILLAVVILFVVCLDGSMSSNVTDCHITVVSGNLYMKENGGEYEFMGTDYNNYYCKIGTHYSVKAQPDGEYEFLYWKNSNGKILSTDEEYSFVLGLSTSITAVYNRNYSSRSYVTFISASNQEISRQLYSLTVDAEKIQIANDIQKIGYSFVGWSIDGVNAIESDSLKLEIFNAIQNGNVTLTPIYEKDTSESYGITVVGGSGSGDYSLMQLVTVTAEPSNGISDFCHWENSHGEIVSYDESYKFAVTGSDTLTACYEGQSVGIVNRISGGFSYGGDVTFVSERSLPEDYRLIQSGIIITSVSSVRNDNGKFIIGGSGVERGATSSTQSKGIYMLTKTNASGNWFARSYVVYENSLGEIFTDYGNIINVIAY